jgi:hypothetical protein
MVFYNSHHAWMMGATMPSEKTWEVIHRIYDNVQMALVAVGCAVGLYFVMFVLPHVSKIQAAAESGRILQITAESRHYCEKWGMHEGTENYLQCTLDLQQIRANTEARLIASDIF